MSDQQFPCPACKGKGQVTTLRSFDIGGYVEKNEWCRRCEGKGRVDLPLCSREEAELNVLAAARTWRRWTQKAVPANPHPSEIFLMEAVDTFNVVMSR